MKVSGTTSGYGVPVTANRSNFWTVLASLPQGDWFGTAPTGQQRLSG
jgi:hypothetical protein